MPRDGRGVNGPARPSDPESDPEAVDDTAPGEFPGGERHLDLACDRLGRILPVVPVVERQLPGHGHRSDAMRTGLRLIRFDMTTS